jgi:hypothetical protein
MKTVSEVEERTDNIILRVTEIFTELKQHSHNPLMITNLAEELEALFEEYSIVSAVLQNIDALTEMQCSGPH